MKWLYVLAGSSVAYGIMSYSRGEKRCAKTSFMTIDFKPTVKWDYNWDRKELLQSISTGIDESNKNHAERGNVLATASRHLIFIRHGHYNYTGTEDVDRFLTASGRSQSDATGLRLKQLNFDYSRIVQSTMTRAKETASLIHRHLPHVPLESCSLLCEGCPYDPEPTLDFWHEYDERKRYADGSRIESAFRKYFYRADTEQKSDSYEIFVCHANVIRFFACRALQLPPEAWVRFDLHNCSLTWIVIRPTGRVWVYTIGDCGHLPPEKLSLYE